MRSMKALVLEKGKLQLRDIPKPVPSMGEALIKVLKAGICNTDLELARGYMSFEGVFVEPLAAALEILEQVKIGKNDEVLVLGDGKLGLLAARVMRLKTSFMSCCGKHERNRKTAAEKVMSRRWKPFPARFFFA